MEDVPKRTFAVCLTEELLDHAEKMQPDQAPPPLEILDATQLSGVRDLTKRADELLSATYGKRLSPANLKWLKATVPTYERAYFESIAKIAVLQSFDAADVDNTTANSLHSYIGACWQAHASDPVAHSSPSITLMQSAGFGKSRLLYEVAKRGNDGQDLNSMGVLYVNLWSDAHVTAYPKTHPRLREYLFPPVPDPDRKGFSGWVSQRLVNELVTRLVTIFMLANANDTTWPSIRDQWLRLFTSEDADGDVVEQLKLASEVDTQDPASSSTPATSNRVVVLAIDGADWLWPHREGGFVDWYWTFSRALVVANKRLRGRLGDAKCGLFAVLVTVYSPPVKCLSAVAIEREDDAAASISNNNSKAVCVRRAVPFAPFIVADTMDVHHKQAFRKWRSKHKKLSSTECWSRFHQEMVLHQDRDAKFSMESLISMGRPLWKACILPHWMTTEYKAFDEFYRVVTVAAHKLLASETMPTEIEAEDKHMGGVASVLCRTSVQINSSKAEAVKLVARRMAVLTGNRASCADKLTHCSYPSDPILAFGAAEAWYEGTKHDPNWLAASILPTLFVMIDKRMVLVDNMRILATKILLLVIIDQCMASSVKFHHQFLDVATFMSYLPPVVGSSGDDHMEKWRGWKLGFNHFLELEQMPTEGCLWAMVSRRAAGVFPRSQQGMDLFIPIFTGGQSPRVSMIIIQVQRGSASTSHVMQPCLLLDAAPYVESLQADQLLRFVMILDAWKEDPRRAYHGDDDTGYWLMHCTGAWKRTTKEQQSNGDAEEVVSQLIADRLINLLRLEGMLGSASLSVEAVKDRHARAHVASNHNFDSLVFGESDTSAKAKVAKPSTAHTPTDAVAAKPLTKTPRARARPAPPVHEARRKSPRFA